MSLKGRLFTLLPGLMILGLAQATTFKPLTLVEQAKKAEVIVRATVGAPTTVKMGNVSYDVYPLNVSETLVGNPATLPQAGGKPAVLFLKGLQDLPALREKQEAYFLLYSKVMDSPLVGFNQGFYPIEDKKVKAGDITEVSALRDALRNARGGQ